MLQGQLDVHQMTSNEVQNQLMLTEQELQSARCLSACAFAILPLLQPCLRACNCAGPPGMHYAFCRCFTTTQTNVEKMAREDTSSTALYGHLD